MARARSHKSCTSRNLSRPLLVNILLASKACQKLATMGQEWLGTEDMDRFTKILKVSAAAGLDKFNEERAATPRDVD